MHLKYNNDEIIITYQCMWMYLKHECSMEMLSWVSDTPGFLVLSLPHVKFTFTSVILCLVFVAYFLFYFISQSSCVFNYLLSLFCACWHGIIWIYFAISVHGFCNSGPWTTKQVQHTKGIFPLSVSTGINTGNRYKQSHETIISLPREPRVFSCIFSWKGRCCRIWSFRRGIFWNRWLLLHRNWSLSCNYSRDIIRW